MNYREQFYEGEIDGKSLLDVIDEKEAEAQALREGVAAMRARVVVVPDALRHVFTPDHAADGWNACLDELERLNGKTVSEGLLRRIASDPERGAPYADLIELRALLGEGKEHE